MRTKSAALLLPLLAAGCSLFQAREAPRSPPYGAPYDGLANKSVAIVIYVPPATANEYTGAREEISSFIAAEFREHLPTVELLDPKIVTDWQDDTINWQGLAGDAVGRHFGVDRVLYIEVLDYSARKVLRYSNLQGQLRALCKIYESGNSGTSSLPPFLQPAPAPAPARAPSAAPAWTGLVDAHWPQMRTLDPTQTNEAAVRLQTLDAFADQLVAHFYGK